MSSMATANSIPILHNMKELLKSDLFSDLTIICKDETTGQKTECKAHKIVIYASSPVLRKTLVGSFKEAQENLGILTLFDGIPAFEALLNYMYTYTYSDTFVAADERMEFAVEVYAVADKYEVSGLQHLAATWLQTTLREAATPLKDFFALLRAIDTSTNPADATFWNVVLPVIKKNFTMLLDSEEFKQLVSDMPELNLKLLSMLKEPDKATPASTNVAQNYAQTNALPENTAHVNWIPHQHAMILQQQRQQQSRQAMAQLQRNAAPSASNRP